MRRVAAVLVIVWSSVGIACTTTAEPGDGGADAASEASYDGGPDGGGTDGDAACYAIYTQPGCGAAPVCLPGPFDACAGVFCGCDQKSYLGGCGFSDEPFASFGLCDGDVGDAPTE